MRKVILILGITVLLVIGCLIIGKGKQKMNDIDYFTKDTKVVDVINNSSFKDFGKLIFPTNRTIDKNMTLEDAKDLYVWYNYINTDKTVEIVNYMKEQADYGKQIFYPIYTEEEMKRETEKRNTGIFYFRGTENNKFAILNAGGGFMYVGAMQDSFPHALELSKNGYNAFALIYRPDADKAMEDLARAVAFIHENKDILKVDTNAYSIWGGSAEEEWQHGLEITVQKVLVERSILDQVL